MEICSLSGKRLFTIFGRPMDHGTAKKTAEIMMKLGLVYVPRVIEKTIGRKSVNREGKEGDGRTTV